MADRNRTGDPKDVRNDDGAGGGGSGSTNPPDLGSVDRPGSMESDSGKNQPQADRYMSIGNGGSAEGGKSHGVPNLHGSSGSDYLHGSSNGYANLHRSDGGIAAAAGGGRSGYPHGLANGYGDPHGFVNGYANLHWGGGGSRAIPQPAPDNLSNSPYSNWYGGAGVWPQQAPMNNYYLAVPRFVPNGNGAISHPPPPPQRPGSHDPDMDALISDQLGSLTIGNGYAGRRNAFAEFQNQRHRQDRRVPENTVPANVHPYWGMTLESVKGSVVRVAKNLHGCQFLCRLVKERREEAVRQLFDEVENDIVRLMGGVGAEFVNSMSTLWTERQVTRVIQTLGPSPPWEVMAAARNQSGSNVLQNLISRIEGRREEIKWFIHALARLGQRNMLALIRDQAGSRVIQKCLETFSPEDNVFIVWLVMNNPYDVAYDKHGCHTMKSCIGVAIDAETRDCLVYAVCAQGLGLAQNQYGNYVVQHVIKAVPGVPWAMEMLHASFLGSYASLSRQKASSNVVQACLAFFPQALSYEIVWELLSHDNFPDLIQDPFANYVLQSAVSTTQGPLLRLLQEAVRPYRNALRDSMHARRLLEMLFPSRRQQFL